jgi:hypothetical protein
MKKKFVFVLMALVIVTMLTVNFSVLKNSKTGLAIIDLVTVAQADAEGGCYVTGPAFWINECWVCFPTNCGNICYNMC